MISRVAESCFWLNRYLERVETLARLLSVNLAFQLDVDLPEAERWKPIVIVTGEQARFEAKVGARHPGDAETVQEFLVWDRDNPSSLVSSLFWARENARTIRETVSLEMWETLNGLWLWLAEREARRLYERERHGFYLQVRDRCLLFHAHCQATMLHEEPFDFMHLGTALERASQTARVLDVKYHTLGPTDPTFEAPEEAAEWLAVLRSCSAIEPFFKRSGTALSGANVAAFLLFDPSFPRSVRQNLDRAWNFLCRVNAAAPEVGERSARRLEGLRGELRALDIDRVLERGLHDVLTWVVDATADVGAAVHADFFDPARLPSGAQTQVQTPRGQRQTQAGS